MDSPMSRTATVAGGATCAPIGGGHGGRDGAESSVHIGGQWVHFHKTLRRLRLKVSTTGEETLDIAYGLGPLAQHYWDVDFTRRGRLVRLPGIRFDVELGLTGASWCFGQDDQSWHSDASLLERLRRNDVHWLRLGWYRRDVEKVKTVDCAVPLPEGAAPVQLTLERSVWSYRVGPYRWTRRSRRPGLSFYLPVLRRILWHAEVETPTGLPVPGKGENSWDCGPDTILGLHTPVRPPFDSHSREWEGEAIAAALDSVLRDRTRYGTGVMDTGR